MAATIVTFGTGFASFEAAPDHQLWWKTVYTVMPLIELVVFETTLLDLLDKEQTVINYILLAALLLLVATFFVAILLIWKVPKWQLKSWRHEIEPKELIGLENQARATFIQALGGFIQAVGGAVLVIGVFFTYKNIRLTQENADKTYRMTFQGQVTDRFHKSVGELGNDDPGKLAVRLGGIYALEGVAKESDDYRWPVIEVLTSYVRQHATNDTNVQKEAKANFSQEIYSILVVLGRRNSAYQKEEENRLDLRFTNIGSVRLPGAHFEGADFTNSKLQADLSGAHLDDAIFTACQLQGSQLNGASLKRAIFHGALLNPVSLDKAELAEADFEDANLEGARFGQANVEGAIFKRANLKGADLKDAVGLTWDQIKEASIDEQTKLPPYLGSRR